MVVGQYRLLNIEERKYRLTIVKLAEWFNTMMSEIRTLFQVLSDTFRL